MLQCNIYTLNLKFHMHNDNIELLREEAQRLLKLEINVLQKMLTEQGVLSSSDQTGSFSISHTAKSVEVLNGELHKLENLELVLAVVGTMKAGKSTSINAIVGTEVLPNRNRPMTAIPTLIEHTPGQIEPVLEFTNRQPLENLTAELRKALDNPKAASLAKDLARDKDMAALLNLISAGETFQSRYLGAEQIFVFLKSLNDLVRLSAELNVAFPFECYDEMHEIPSIKVEFAHLRNGLHQSQGRLTLLDTPGPNESGQPHLHKMLKEQLSKASAVLAVLDYSQLKSEADAQVRADLKDISKLAEGRLYALVNKFDQRDRNGDSAEAIKAFVADNLMHGDISVDHVFPVSSKQAYLASRAQQELATQGGMPDDAQHPWVVDFGEEALGRKWKKDIDDVKVVQEAAAELWNDSMFQEPIDKVIRFAQGRAAILALDSASVKLSETADQLANFFNIRETALGKSASDLQVQIEALKQDILSVTQSEAQANGKAEEMMDHLLAASDALLRQVREDVDKEINDIFEARKQDEKAQHEQEAEGDQSAVSLFGLAFQRLLGGKNKSPRTDIPHFDYDEPVMTFSNQDDARLKLTAVQQALNGIVKKGEESMQASMAASLRNFEENFQTKVLQSASAILDSMSKRLQGEGFELHIEVPSAQLLSLPQDGAQLMESLINAKTESHTRSRRSSGAWGTVCGWFNSDDWGWETYTVNVDTFTIDARQIKVAVSTDIAKVFNGLNQAVDASIRLPLKERIDDFFAQFKTKVEYIRGDLLQGVQDINRSKDEQHDLLLRLQALRRHVPAIRTDCHELKTDVKRNLTDGTTVQA